MARTTITTSDALRKQAWEEELYRDIIVDTFFINKFGGSAVGNLIKGMSEGKLESSPNDVLHIKTDLGAQGRTKTRNGDKLTFGIVPRLDPQTNAGVTSGQTLKGKEIALSWYSDSIELERYRQAVSGGGVMDWSRASFDMPKEARAALQAWGAEKMELNCFDALVSSPSSIFYKTSDTGPAVSKTATLATAKTALVAADSKLTPDYLSYLKTWARTGGARANGQIPLKPIMIGGKPHYIYITHPDALFDWRTDANVQQAMREAEVRGKENPLFAGASYVWDGIIIHEHEFVTKGTDAGAGGNVAYCYGHLLGAQSLIVGFGERPSIVEETEDYEEDLFYAYRMTMKVKKPTFNSKDYGSIAVLTSRTNVSGT